VYSNHDLKVLISEAQAGGEAEHGRLQVAVWQTLESMVGAGRYGTGRTAKMFSLTAVAKMELCDAVGDSFLPITNKIIRLYDSTKSQPTTTLYHCYCNHMRNIIIKNNTLDRKHTDVSDVMLDSVGDEGGTPSALTLEASEFDGYKRSELRKAILTLPLKQQDALEGYMRGEPCKVTCKLMGVTTQRAHQIRQEAFGSLKQILKNKLE